MVNASKKDSDATKTVTLTRVLFPLEESKLELHDLYGCCFRCKSEEFMLMVKYISRGMSSSNTYAPSSPFTHHLKNTLDILGLFFSSFFCTFFLFKKIFSACTRSPQLISRSESHRLSLWETSAISGPSSQWCWR